MRDDGRITALIVDDEEPARLRIHQMLAGEDDVVVCGEAADAFEALERIRTLRPDLLFLDIHLPGKHGFDLLAEIPPEAMPVVIFLTAYSEFAARAFDVDAADYVMKPFARERFLRALGKARLELARPPAGEGEAAEPLSPLDERGALQRIVFRYRRRLMVVRTSEIHRIDAEGSYVRIHLGAASYLLRQTLGRYEELLDPARFVRVHRSSIVNLEHVQAVGEASAGGSRELELTGGRRVSLSRRYSGRFFQALTARR